MCRAITSTSNRFLFSLPFIFLFFWPIHFKLHFLYWIPNKAVVFRKTSDCSPSLIMKTIQQCKGNTTIDYPTTEWTSNKAKSQNLHKSFVNCFPRGGKIIYFIYLSPASALLAILWTVSIAFTKSFEFKRGTNQRNPSVKPF